MIKGSLITIIIPVYNEEQYLGETIESLINQTLTNIRIHISDNQSTDKTLLIAKQYEQKDSRIKIFEQKEHKSAHNNFKFLIDSVETPFTTIVGGHDKLAPDCIESCYKKFTEEGIVCVFPKAEYFGLAQKTGNPNSDIGIISYNKALRAEKLLKNLFAGTAVYSTYRTDTLKKILLRPIRGGDLNLLFQVIREGSIISTDKVLYYRREDRIEDKKQKTKRYLNYVGIKKEYLGFSEIIKTLTKYILEDKDFDDSEKKNLCGLVINKYQKNVFISPFQLRYFLKKMPFGDFLEVMLSYMNGSPEMLKRSLLRLIR